MALTLVERILQGRHLRRRARQPVDAD
jgi:hypothetical protein